MSSHRKELLSDIPATIDHQATIEESDQEDLRLSAKVSVTRARAATATKAQPKNGKSFGRASGDATKASQKTAVNSTSLSHPRLFSNRIQQQPLLQDLEDICGCCSRFNFSHDEYFAAIRQNPVVESYRQAWGAEPSWLPRACGVYLQTNDPARTHDIEAPQEMLARILTEVGALSASRSAVLSNARHISQFLVPAGMPYAIAISSVFGIVVCTPFYSTIPAAFPDVPDSLFSMRNLTIARVIENPVFRHEFTFNTNLKVEVPSQLTYAINNCALWQHLERETEEVLASPIARAPTPMLPIFLNETRKIMLAVMPGKLSSYINFHFDTERLLGGGLSSDNEMLEKFLSFIYSLLEACVLPIRKQWILKMRQYFDEARESPKALVAGFRIAVWLLNQTKIDFINAQVKERAAILNESVTSVEREYYESLLAQQCGLRDKASEWLSVQPTISELCIACNVPHDGITELPKHTTIPYIGRLVAGFVWSVLRPSRKLLAPPELFALDEGRIKTMQRLLESFIIERLEKDVMIGCSWKYQQHLPVLMRERRFEQSPLFLLIEKRVLGGLALQVFKNIVGLTPSGTASLQTWKQSSPGRRRENLDFLTYEISTLLALHWRAAGFIYTDKD